jgi:uncharacterized protein YegP (UPF0339 family)
MKKIEVFKAGLLKRQWAFRFVSDNGEKVAQSETYSRRLDAENAARLVRDDFRGVDVLVVDG